VRIDYLIRAHKAPEIGAFLEARRGRNLLHHFLLPAEQWVLEGGGVNRLRYPHFERVPVRTRLLRLPIPRRLPAGLEPFGGMAYRGLTGSTLAHMMELVSERPEVLRFFSRTKMPDETFFQTVIMSGPLATTVDNEELHYHYWSAGNAHPAVLGVGDLPKLRASDKLFARKFDAAVDSAILDLLDEEPAGVP
jgi:hypothetical protein